MLTKEDLHLVPFGDESLRRPPTEFNFEEQDAKEVENVLFEKMREFKGVGLSANQMGLDMKVFCMEIAEAEFKRCMFNPLVIDVSDKQTSIKEGCLSIPGLWLVIRRPEECTVRYYDSEGKEVIERFKDVAARIALHEYDHMLGYNFTQRVSKFKLDRALKALQKKVKKIQRRAGINK